MQTRFNCHYCGKEIFSWESRTLHGIPISCPHCEHGALVSPLDESGEAFIVYSKPATILWLTIRWLVVGGFSLFLFGASIAVFILYPQHPILYRASAALILLITSASLVHICIYGRLRKYGKFEHDREAHRIRLRSLKKHER
jgi:DNA-directed RNA polymerase subunit RPC12/RpoP